MTALAATGAVTLAGAGFLAARLLFGGGGEPHRAETSISVPRTPEHYVDPELASLQKDYEDSHAVFQTGDQPFPTGFTPAEQAQYQKLDAEIKAGKLTNPDDFGKFESLRQQHELSSKKVAKAEELTEKYDGKFMGK